MNRKNIEDAYPLSPMQQGMLFHSLYAPASGIYVEQMSFDLRGDLNVAAFAQAWQQVVDRHPVLRTAFVWELEKPLQVVGRQVTLPWEELDWRGVPSAEQPERLKALLQSDRQQGFELSKAPLMRLILIQLSEETYHFIWSHHHLLLDGWSVPILFQEVIAYYEAFCQGKELYLARPRPYRDYIAWLQQQDLSQAEGFWRVTLKGFTAATSLGISPIGKPLSNQEEYDTAQEISLSTATTAALQSLAKQHQLTLNTLVQGAWALLLNCYSGEEDVVFGATVSGRPPTLAKADSMVGLFINTLPVRVQVTPEQSLLSWLKQLQAQQVEARQYEYTPLVEVQKWSDVPPGQPLFESLVVFENYPIESSLQERGLNLEILNLQGFEKTNYPLTLSVVPGSQLLVRMAYTEGKRFDAATIQRMLGHLQTLLESMVANPEQPLSEFSPLTSAEWHQLGLEWNRRGEVSSPKPDENFSLCIHQLFEAQVERNPDAIAVVFEDIQTQHVASLTYRELNEKANQLAHHLQSLGIKPDVLVGICVERSLEMIIGILGILKAGSAYVPLDCAYPKERLAYILQDTQAPVLLTQQHLLEKLPEHEAKVICLDTNWVENCESVNLQPTLREGLRPTTHNLQPSNLAYVIYTSGSTGQPKGVLVTHHNVTRLFAATQSWFHFNEQDVWTLFHSYAFDFSVWEIWGALLYGGRLVIVPYWISRSPEAFYELLCKEQVTVLNQTPSAFRQLMWAEEQICRGVPTPENLNLRLVIFGGEALELQSLKPWFDRHGDQRPQLVNMYGITETTVHVTYRPLTIDDLNGTTSVIGVPIPDLQVYILNKHHKPVPIGVPGEMYVGGAGVARGYLNRPELTAERFISLNKEKGKGKKEKGEEDNFLPTSERLYKTGDLARYLPNGDIEYLGRIDHQVKVRGFRIELGEIEAALVQHSAVREAVVLVREDYPGNKQLVAYIVPNPEQVTNQWAQSLAPLLRQYLKEKLPEYMVPAVFIQLKALPLTVNGKVDRRALPAPDTVRPEFAETFVAPRTREEKILADVWAKVLKLERVGIHDNFFALGGDSIRTIQVQALAQKQGVKFSLQQLFQYQTIHAIVQELKSAESEYTESSNSQSFSLISSEDKQKLPDGVEDAYPLTMLQAGMIFHSEYSQDAVYHEISSFHLQSPFNLEALQTAIQKLMARHPVLRTSFQLTGFREPLQLVHRQVALPLQVEDLRHLSSAEQEQALDSWMEAEKSRHFDWTRPPLVRFQVHRRTETTFQLTLSCHHAILDGWSVASLLTELFQDYLSLSCGLALPEKSPLGLSFRDFVALERQALNSQECKHYWQQKLSDFVYGNSRCVEMRNFASLQGKATSDVDSLDSSSLPSNESRTQVVAISPKVSEKLKQLSQLSNVPLKSVLLTAHLRVLSLLTHQSDLVTGLVSNGRPEESEGERVLGLFLNTLPFRLKLQGDSWINLVQETFKAECELLPFRRYPLAQIQQDLGGQPLFETAFNFTHFHVYQDLLGRDELQVLGGKFFEETNFALVADFRLNLSSSLVELTLNGKVSDLSAVQLEMIGGYYAKTLTAMTNEPASHFEFLSEQEQLLEAFPRTPNTPLRRDIPDFSEKLGICVPHSLEKRGKEDVFVAPRTSVEEVLTKLWAEVLNLKQVSIHDNFFELGGHSLLATQLISRIRDTFQIELPLRRLFEFPTAASLSKCVEAAKSTQTKLSTPPLVPVSRTGELPLSFAQARLWFLDQLDPGNCAYNIPAAVRLSGVLDVEALQLSLNAIIHRHEALRTTFRMGSQQPIQLIAPSLNVILPIVDLRELSSAEQEAEVQRLAAEEAQRPFDLEQGPLLRGTLLQLSETEHVVLFTLHHIVSDGWSMGVLIREVAALYEDAITEDAIYRVSTRLADLPIQYADFAVWQRQWLQGDVLETQLNYWKHQLRGAPTTLNLPTDRPRPAVSSFRGATQSFVLPASLSNSLKTLSQQAGVTLFMTLLAAFQVQLSRYSHQGDIVVGTDVANRNRSETEGLIGFFVNLLVLRTDLSGNPSFRELLGRVREVTLGAYAHQDLPFAKLVDALQLGRNLSHNPLFQVLFVLQNAPMSTLQLPGLTLTPMDIDTGTAKFDLALFMEETEQGLVGTWNYSTDLFDASTIAKMSSHLETLLNSIVAQPDAQINTLEMLSKTEKQNRLQEQKQREAAKFKKFKVVKPKAVSLPEGELIKTDHLNPKDSLPLVIQPNADDIDLADWAKNQREFLETQLFKHGAILFRNFNTQSVAEFERVAQAICSELFEEYGDLPRQGVSGKVYASTPYPADKMILFHNESSHLQRWPLKIWFFCVQPAQEGGETPIVDCRQIYQLINPQLRERFEQKQLMYVRNFIEGLDVSWEDFFRTTDKAVVEEYCRNSGIEFEWLPGNRLRTRQIRQAVAKHPHTNQWVFFNQLLLHHVSCLDSAVQDSLLSLYGEEQLPRNVYYGDGSPIEQSVIQEIQEVYQQATISFPWQKGDILMLDNMLAAHGRNPFVGSRKIVVAMGEMMTSKKSDI